MEVIVQEGGGILYLKSLDNIADAADVLDGISIYEPASGKFIPLRGNHTEVWSQLSSGFHIIRVTYNDRVKTIKIIKQ